MPLARHDSQATRAHRLTAMCAVATVLCLLAPASFATTRSGAVQGDAAHVAAQTGGGAVAGADTTAGTGANGAGADANGAGTDTDGAGTDTNAAGTDTNGAGTDTNAAGTDTNGGTDTNAAADNPTAARQGNATGSDGASANGGGALHTDTPASVAAERRARPARRAEFEEPSAASLSPAARHIERSASCKSKNAPLPTSGMLGLKKGTLSSDHSHSSAVLLLGIVGLAAAGGLLWWRFRDRWRSGQRKGVLDIIGASIAIATGAVALAAQFIPGVGVQTAPPPELTMAVTQVHARVQHHSYAQALGDDGESGHDPLEIGNVVWLQVAAKGFKDRRLELQWAEYNLDTGGALLPRTSGARTFHVRHDAETDFVPVWVGYPRSGRFQVQLRMLDHDEVVAMARTGEMRGTQYRFACVPQP